MVRLEEEDGRAGRLGRRGRREESLFLTWEAVWVMQGAKLSRGRNQRWTEPMGGAVGTGRGDA